jgi:hypothetical protein
VTPDARGMVRRRWPAALAWTAWTLTLICLAAAAWFHHLLGQAGMPELGLLSAANIPLEVVAPVSAATVGAVVASRRPDHPVGWLMLLGLGLSVTVFGATFGYTRYGLVARPGALPAAGYLAGFCNGMVLIWLSCAGFVLLLTPTGSLPSARWRWWARAIAAAAGVWLLGSIFAPAPLYPEYPNIENPLAIPAMSGPLGTVIPAAGVVVLAALVVGAGSLVGRFRRARGIERQQLRWLAFGAVLAAIALLIAVADLVRVKSDSGLFQAALGVCAVLLPLATGAAVVRYRLYDLDRIISRTVAYGILTVLLGGGYTGLVLGLGQLLGRESPLVVAGATLTVFAAFQPARRRTQEAVDRRFNRRRYDAARTIEEFRARLRQQVNLDTVTAELLTVVEQTVQPTRVSLWLRPSINASTITATPAPKA